MSTPRIVVYSTAYCGYCRRAEDLLRSQGIDFETVDVTGDAPARAKLVDLAGGRHTLPVVLLDGKPIGGYLELAEMVREGGLKRIIVGA